MFERRGKMSKVRHPNKLSFYRKKKGLTQKSLAKKLNITHEYVSILERGLQTPSLLLAKNIADELKLTVDEIFFENTQNKTFDK